MRYYTPLIILTWMTLIILSILVKENLRLSREKKRILYLSYLIIGVAAFAEWLGVQFNGNPDIPVNALKFAKFVDYALTPVAGGIIVLQFQKRSIWFKAIRDLLCVNALFQLISLFTGWMLTVDPETHFYSHGRLYPLYIILYLAILVLVIIEFAIYGEKFSKQNRVSLYCILVFIASGAILQEIGGNEAKTAYISMAIGMVLLFIHNEEFTQQKADARLREQMVQVTIDPLTGVSSRQAYADELQKLNKAGSLPKNFVVFSIDINGLKRTNDTLGHKAGDELICGAAECIVDVFEKYGTCFRTGGDEFIVLANMEKDKVPQVLDELKKKTSEWHGKGVPFLYLAAGSACAADCPDIIAEKLITIADREMYKAKAEYYMTSGEDRRKN